MSKIKNAFENGKAFIGFLTAGDPSMEMTEKLILAMDEAGAIWLRSVFHFPIRLRKA